LSPEFHPLYRAFFKDCRIAFASLSEGLAGAIHDEDDMQIFANALSEERNLKNICKLFKSGVLLRGNKLENYLNKNVV
jgi:hypothetical protein